ncbi:MAG: SusC/RagA family TonB-linked outer membrane protein [Bacteroidales bacterium]
MIKNVLNEIRGVSLIGVIAFFVFGLLLVSSSSFASQANQVEKTVVVKGQVLDANGVPMPGVTVAVKGGTQGVITDKDGNYVFKDVPAKSTLVFSFVGMKSQEVVVNGKTVVDIKLKPDTEDLDEVVVVGYGTQKKMTTIGSQSSIKAGQLESQPVSNISNTIAGRVAGVVAVQRSGEPGYDDSEIYIRGISSFTSGNSSPLVLVDGIERSFSQIDPQDIESFTVLKDASATAVYGVRGANGVILVETKKGSHSKPKVNIQASTGITQFTKVPKFADGVTYMKVANEAYSNTNPESIPLYSEELIEKTASGEDPDLYPNVNWIDELFSKAGKTNRVNMNVDGGSQSAKYYLSIGYYDETGLYNTANMHDYNANIKYTRYNFTSNLSLDILKRTKLDFGASGYISNGNYPGAGTGAIWGNAYRATPITMPAIYSDGTFAGNKTGDVDNPYNLLNNSGFSNVFKSQIWSNIKVTQDLGGILDGLKVSVMYSFDNFNEHNISRSKSVTTYQATGRDAEGNLIFGDPVGVGSDYLGYNRSNGGSRQFYLEAAINYAQKFALHDVTTMVLYNQSDRVDAFAGDFVSSIPYRFQGIAARATYSYANRYLAEANLGYNGSETFKKGERFGLFPSFGLGWVISEEQFFDRIKPAVQFLKIRSSYGIVGNSNMDGRRFAYLSDTNGGNGGYSFGNNVSNDYDGLDIGNYVSDVTWETAVKMNYGIELRTWSEDLQLTIDYFTEDRTGIFRQRGDMPLYAGVRSNPWGNIGAIQNRGIEGSLVLNKQLNRDWGLELRGNFTWNRATVVDDANAPWPYPWQQRIGRKLGQRFGLVALGLFESEDEIKNSPFQAGDIKPGDIKYKDMNGDGTIDDYDKAPIGFGSIPEVVYGFGPSIRYKGWALGAWFKGISNVDIGIGGEGLQPFRNLGKRGNLYSNIDNRWTAENPSQNVVYPRLTYPSTSNTNYEDSSWWIKNGAFLRLQNIELSYTLPREKIAKIGLSSLRIYAVGYNVATFSEFDMWDVELGDGRGDSYPLTKMYTIGVDFQF